MTQFEITTSHSHRPPAGAQFPRVETPHACSRFFGIRPGSLEHFCVMSKLITWPVSPTARAARKQSKPAPLPRSSTVSPGRNDARAIGFPQPNPRFALRNRAGILFRVAARVGLRVEGCHGGVSNTRHLPRQGEVLPCMPQPFPPEKRHGFLQSCHTGSGRQREYHRESRCPCCLLL